MPTTQAAALEPAPSSAPAPSPVAIHTLELVDSDSELTEIFVGRRFHQPAMFEVAVRLLSATGTTAIILIEWEDASVQPFRLRLVPTMDTEVEPALCRVRSRLREVASSNGAECDRARTLLERYQVSA